jgi:hypothetical protein
MLLFRYSRRRLSFGAVSSENGGAADKWWVVEELEQSHDSLIEVKS